MKITDIHVDGFGVWNSMSVDELSDGATLFFGRNEAGKTTLMQFIRAALYGFSPDRRRLYLPPVHGGIPGGMLRVQNHSVSLSSNGDNPTPIQMARVVPSCSLKTEVAKASTC